MRLQNPALANQLKIQSISDPQNLTLTDIVAFKVHQDIKALIMPWLNLALSKDPVDRFLGGIAADVLTESALTVRKIITERM